MKEDPVFDNAKRISFLVASFIQGTLTARERDELDEWILSSEANELLFDELIREENTERTMHWFRSLNGDEAWRNVRRRIKFKRERRKIVSFPMVGIAASVLVVATIVVFIVSEKRHVAPATVSNTPRPAVVADVSPGTDKAVLTLANGRKVVLDSTAAKGLGDGITIDDGTLAYNNTTSTASENILSVPRGGQYKLVLADGTKVWLNAESSLSYPTVFTGNDRKVTLTGEGYFEVAKNKEKPFIVTSGGNTIEVLGTHFNVNGYGDDNSFTTTLLEGSVRLSNGNENKILKPGEQGRVKQGTMSVVPVDTKEAIAWKDGEFVFRNTPVAEIAKQLARWYDVQVEYRDPVDKHLNAVIKRDVPLSKVLHYLEETGDVHFQLDGKKLVVMK